MGRMLAILGAALLVLVQGDAAFARGASSSARGGGHHGHHAHAGAGFVSRAVYVPRPVYYAAPVVYYARSYIAPAYYPPSYYAPAPPVSYVQPPVQSYAPAPAYAPPPPPPAPAASAEPASQNPIYACRDASGRMVYTNRKEDTAGKDCSSQTIQPSQPQAAAKGPYAAADATRYRYFCPDTRKYYPEVNTCDSAWLKVVPERATAAR
jgi:hypothetical protein